MEIFISIVLLKLQPTPREVQWIGKNTIQVYHCGEKEYKILTKIKRGPNKLNVVKIEDMFGDDVTKTIQPYMGPNEDWHRIPYTLDDFEQERLTFVLQNGDKKTIENTNTILPIF
jgi:ribosomal protein L24E